MKGREEGKRACVIGAGFGGLALAIRLQAAGLATTVVEARDRPGGRAGFWQRDGFTFDGGPAAITNPGAFRELWQLTGDDMAADVELLPVSPLCRFNWPDGTTFDLSNDEVTLRREIARIDAADLAGYEGFRAYAAAAHREGNLLAGDPVTDLGSMVRGGPALAKLQAWRSLYAVAGRFVRNDKLRQALTYRSVLVGGNPLTASPLLAQDHKLEQDGGVWCARGGTGRLIAALARQFERIGGELRLQDPAVRIETSGHRASEIATRSGWRARFDTVASNAGVVHTYRDLLGPSARGQVMARRLAKKRFGPSAFVLHFGIEGHWPGIPHHMILFGPRFDGFLNDIFENGVLPADLAICLHHPTVTDPSLAPEGMSTFCAWVPVPHLGKLALDWGQVGELLGQRILDEIERRLIPDIRDRIVTSFHYTPRDYALDLHAHLGSAFGLEPVPLQSGYFRPHNRDAVLQNFYLVGADTQPGPGIPAVLAGARATAALMLRDLSR